MKASDVITHFGGIPEAAKALGVTRSAVWQWLERKGDSVPENRQYQVEVVTGGALKADRPEPAPVETSAA